MKTSIRSLVRSSLVIVLLPLSVLADISIYSARDGIADGWRPIAWNGPVTEEVPGSAKNTTALQVSLKPDAQAYAGVVLSANPGSEIELTDKLRFNGNIVLSLKLGKTHAGSVSTLPQPLQIGLSFRTTEGQTVHGKFVTQASLKTSSATSEEGQIVTVSIPASFEGIKAPELLVAISSIRFQFVDTPIAGFQVLDCTIKSE
jgi:hypothetical protein